MMLLPNRIFTYRGLQFFWVKQNVCKIQLLKHILHEVLKKNIKNYFPLLRPSTTQHFTLSNHSFCLQQNHGQKIDMIKIFISLPF